MTRPDHPDFSTWVLTHGVPAGKPHMLERPRRARVRTATYSGRTVDVVPDVIATATGMVCVRQEFPGREPWNAWIPSEHARAFRESGGSRRAPRNGDGL